ncbi:AAA domain-containing protein [Desertivirga brevis]|uniref:AAA domain-containing protein n=1 Tax=Desertivirga brevis TaxID=2810310 RepID=UPI001A96DB8F|nr:AAA domain-containing protein [Pedobacter sp. SYSU D00873]
MKPSKKFLEFLEQKLKVGNIRSIHLNAVPGKSNKRLDISLLKYLQVDQPSLFLSELLNKKCFTHKISAKDVNLSKAKQETLVYIDSVFKKLENIYLENISDELEHGVKTFACGYPLLVKRATDDQKKVIIAPLIIWRLDLKMDPRNNNLYTISRSEEDDIFFNPQLKAFLKSDEKLEVSGVPDELLEDGILQEDELLKVINQTLRELKSPEVEQLEEVSACEDKTTLVKRTGNTAWIKWSGVFGLFRSQKESIIKDIEELISGYDKYTLEPPENAFKDSFITSANAVDPSQEELLNNLNTNQKIIIQGPPGTGKSQSLTALITHALAHGRKVLVVCEKKTAIEVLYNNLSKLGLGHLSATVDDINKDRKKLVTYVRSLIDDPQSVPGAINISKHQLLHNRFVEVRSRVVSKLNNTRTKFFSDYTWKEVVSEYLYHKGFEGKELITGISEFELELSFDEFEYLCSLISDSQSLYGQIATINPEYDFLNQKLFQENVSQKRLLELRELITSKQLQVNELTERVLAAKRKYEASTIAKSVQPGIFNKLLALFNKKLAGAIKETEEIDLLYKKLSIDISMVLDADLSIPDKNSFHSTLNENLDSISSLFSDILKDFGTFTQFYSWRNHAQSVKKQCYYKLLKDLTNAKDQDWLQVFKGWYFHCLLLMNEQTVGQVIKDDQEIIQLRDADSELRKSQIGAICHKWREIIISSINKQPRNDIKQLYNLAKNKKYNVRNSLRRLIEHNFNFFTNIFPVVFVNPSTASSILPLKENLFDYIIFDEASQLKIEDTFAALVRGKYRIVSGDMHQMPPSDSFATKGVLDSVDSVEDEEIENDIDAADKESLLKFADDKGYKFSYLNFHYRSRHPYLIDFSNAAFYDSRLVPMPAGKNYSPISFISVNGVYENNTNPTEAKKVVEILLDEIVPDETGELPSVGVATFNIMQRNLIYELIFQAAEQSEEAYEKISALNRSGLFVKNLENIQGDERDIIIMSTTFGYDVTGNFAQRFGPINQEKGYKLLNVIVTRAKSKLYVLTSIPNKYYSKYQQELVTSGNKGKGVFYAYLAYAEACSLKNEQVRQNILGLLEQNSESNGGAIASKSESLGNTESVFEEEVLNYLNQYLPDLDVQLQYKLGGFRIDMMVLDNLNQPIIAIECDGKSYHSSAEAYRYDLHRQKIIEDLGIKVYRIWSTNWWIDPLAETNKLVKFIEGNLKVELSSIVYK